jgi:hypothetical protein
MRLQLKLASSLAQAFKLPAGPNRCIRAVNKPVQPWPTTMSFRGGRSKEAYYAALERLNGDPHNPELRQELLGFGRQYMKSNYEKFNETILTHDISAGCARAGSEARSAASTRGKPTGRLRFGERLDTLDHLLGHGVDLRCRAHGLPAAEFGQNHRAWAALPLAN